MSIFAIGDLHLSMDPTIDKPMDIYGGAWVNHVENLKNNWLKNITDDDTVIIAGDTSWAMKLDEAMADLQWISNLPGKKVFIKGNHDMWWTGIGRLNNLYDNMYFIQNHMYKVGNTAICGTRGWVCPGSEGFELSDEKIYKRELLRLEASLKEAKNEDIKNIIGVLHYPPTNDKKQMSGFTELFEKYGVKKVVYGHLHGNDAKKNKAAVNYNGVSYKLVSLDGLEGCPIKIK